MPAINVIKPYVQDGIYHIYNRGIDKRTIFQDAQDYEVFINLLKKYLTPTKTPVTKTSNYSIDLISYCLMPNHFHLLLKQHKDTRSISKFIKRLIISYVLYFNNRHNRSGALFENAFKGILVRDDIYFLHLSRYIHLNSSKLGINPFEYNYSSLKNYTGQTKDNWVKSNLLLESFNKIRDDLACYKSYEHFLRY